MSTQSVSAPESSTVLPTTLDTVSSGRWVIAILVACALGWLAYQASPTPWVLSEESSNVSSMSPQPVLDKVRAEERMLLRNNTLLQFVLAGTALGLCGLIAYLAGARRSFVPVIGSLIAGAVGGALAAVVGLAAREYFNKEQPIPMISEDMRPLFSDIVVFALASLFLTLPFAVMLALQSSRPARQKAASVPLAAILVGVIVPIATAFVLSSYTFSDVFPPVKTDLTVLWFATLAVITALLVAFAGDRKPRAQAPVAP